MNFGKLAELYRIHAKEITGDKTARFRINNYLHTAEIINATYADHILVTKERIQSLPITDYMKDRADFFIKRSKEMFDSQTKKKDNLLSSLLKIHGIGVIRAKQLIKNGLTDVSQLKMKKYYEELSQETRTFLKYPPVARIPRAYIQKIDKALDKIRNNYDLTIVGSYRRGKAFSSDIDVMMVKKDNDIQELIKILPDVLKCKLHIYSLGKDKMSAIAVCRNANTTVCRNANTVKFDVFLVDKKRAASMLLYSTGSKEFNIRMRTKAKKLGFLLNQNGLYLTSSKKKLDIKDEQGFFKALNMEYVEPKDRI